MKKNKIKLAVMYGGPGGEHEVSIRSAKNILENIENFRKDKYEVKEIFIPKNVKKFSNFFLKSLQDLKKENFLVWPIFHGEFGEGGYVQKVLENNKIKFIGSNSKTSELAMDKFKTQKVLEKKGILCPRSFLVERGILKGGAKRRPSLQAIIEKMNFPIILKPVNSGSSVDLHKPKNQQELEKSLEILFKKYKQVLLQEFIVGQEFTCGVLQTDQKTLALPVSEIILKGQEIFDYQAKYETTGIEITPAKIYKKLSDKIKKLGKKVHQTIGCLGVTRTDILLDKKGNLFVLEINTIPGLTKVSFIPEQLKAAKITIPEFVDILVENHNKK